MKTLWLLLTMCIVCTLWSGNASASDGFEVQLKSRAFVPPASTKPLFQAVQEQRLVPQALLTGSYHALVQFYDIPTDVQHRALRDAGILLHDYLPQRAYSASIDPSLRASDIPNNLKIGIVE